jgi:hypothetical protein
MSQEMHVGSTIRRIEFSSEEISNFSKCGSRKLWKMRRMNAWKVLLELEPPRAVRISNLSKSNFNYFFTYFSLKEKTI